MAQAKPKGNSVVTTVWTGWQLKIDVLGAGAILFNADQMSKDNRETAEKHGWVQRLCDRAAMQAPTRKALTTEAEWLGILAKHKMAKFSAIAELAQYYEGGDVPWKMTGTAEKDGGLLFTALCEFKPRLTEGQIAEHLKTRTPAQLTEIRAIPEIVDIMNRLRKERVAKVDTKSALGDLAALELVEEGTETANESVE